MNPAGRKYLIDASTIRGGGGFTHLVNVIPELARMAPRDTFRVICCDKRIPAALPELANLEVDYLGELRLRDRVRFKYRGVARRAAEWGADLYFSCGEMAPLSAPCPMVAAFQNPNVFDLGASYKLSWKQQLRLRLLNVAARVSARRCERVLFVSEDSARWMGDAAGLPMEKRVAIAHGIDPARWRRPEREQRESHERPYILSVSSIYPYKNYLRLIEAYAELAESHPGVPDLVIVGDNQDDDYLARMQAAREATGELAEQIHIVGEVSYDEIHRWYHGASLFVFPSYLETFGIPMLEAMAAGLPIVAADTPVFREIAADAAFYADPFDAHAFADAMSEVLFRPGAAAALAKRGTERLREFTWRRSASRLLALFRSVLAHEASAPQPARALAFPLTATRPSALGAPGFATHVMRSH